ncbi:hypothetical protein [Cytobacillus gottheilii]
MAITNDLTVMFIQVKMKAKTDNMYIQVRALGEIKTKNNIYQ